MERRRFTREFKLEAVRLIRDRGVSYAQASEDLGVHPTQRRHWVKAFAEDPQHAFPGAGQMKPEQLEIARLRREVIKLKAERDILKSRGLLREGIDVKFGFIAKHRRSGRRTGCARRSVSRGVASMPGRHGRAAGAVAATKSWARRCVPAAWRATGPTVRGGCGTTCWRTGCHEGSAASHI
jgi:transposase